MQFAVSYPGTGNSLVFGGYGPNVIITKLQ
jgi:hypothetical protein